MSNVIAVHIRDFHAHVYFDAITRPTAERIHDALAHLGLDVGALFEQPVGPHAKPMFQVTITPEQFATVVPWLMVNRSGLSVLVHPTTDDEVADHDTSPLWMGESLPIDVDVIRRHVAAQCGASKAARPRSEGALRA
jgi:DOPA 4,5-dioxygenase